MSSEATILKERLHPLVVCAGGKTFNNEQWFRIGELKVVGKRKDSTVPDSLSAILGRLLLMRESASEIRQQ